MIQAELLDMQADSIGRLLLQVALFNVQDFVKELAHMEAQTHFLGLCKGVGIFVFEDPAAAGSAEFQLVTIKLSGFGGKGRADFRNLKMADSYQLVFYLLTLGLQLHLVRQRLPAAASANAKMLAERLQTVLGGLYNALDKAFHVVLFLFVYLNVHHVSGNGKVHENHHAVHMRESFALSRHGFNGHILQHQVYAFSAHLFKNLPTGDSPLIGKLT